MKMTKRMTKTKGQMASFVAGHIFVLCFWLIAASPIYGQGPLATATLNGQVADQTGAVVPGAQVSLQNLRGGQALSVTSNQQGRYEFFALGPGTYSLRAKMSGFADVVIKDIAIQVAQTSKIDILLEPAAVRHSIEVRASSAALQTQTTSTGGIVSALPIAQLPQLFRDPTTLVNLVPGVVADLRRTKASFAGDAGGLDMNTRLDFEIAGGVREQTQALVDGIDVTVDEADFYTIPVVPTSDSTQEFTVQTTNLSAEYGRGSATLNIVTKSGSNKLHANIYEFLQNDKLNAQDFFANALGQQKTHTQRNQYGFTVGGPIVRDKVWFFGSWEELRQIKFLPIFTQVPTAAEALGDFSNLFTTDGAPRTIYNPFDLYVDPADGKTKRRPFANNQITGTLDPFALNVLKFYGQPNNAGLLGPGGVPTQLGNFAEGSSIPLHWDRFDIKSDYEINSRHKIMGRFSHTKYQTFLFNQFNNAAASEYYSAPEVQGGVNGVLSWTWLVSPSLVISQGGSASRLNDIAENPTPFDPTTLGGPYANADVIAYHKKYMPLTNFPVINPTGYAYLGVRPAYTFADIGNSLSYQFGLVNSRGRHILKSGFQFHYGQYPQALPLHDAGTYNFTGSFTCGPDPLACDPNTGNSVADLLLGLVGSGQQTSGMTTVMASKYYAWYFQDDWRVNTRLTLNLGIRYDLQMPYTARTDNTSRLNLDAPNPIGLEAGPNTNGQTLNQYFTQLVGRPLNGTVIFPSSPNSRGRGLTPTDFSNLAPRLGAAYRISNKLVFRGGFSRLYMLSPVASGGFALGPSTEQATTPIVGTIDGIHPNVTIDNPFPNGFVEPIHDSQGPLSLVGFPYLEGVTNNTGAKTPYMWQWNAGFQYAPTNNARVSIGYIGTRSRRLVCPLLVCTDEISRQELAKFGSSVVSSVANPFYGIITDPKSALSAPTVELGQLLVQTPQFAGFTAGAPTYQGPNSDTFKGSWDGLEVEYKQKISDLTLYVAYTLSKNITNSDSFEAGFLGPQIGYQDMVNFIGERSLAATDATHKLVIGHVWDLPVGHGKHLGASWPSAVDKVLGHWQFSGMTTFQSGFPLAIAEAGHTTGAFGGSDRPNLIGNPCLDSSRSRADKINQYLNPAAFAVPPDFTLGNAPRALNCRADGIKNFDLAAIKFIPFWGDRGDIQFRAEFFNAFNRTMFGAPNTTLNSGAFGVITSTQNSPRIIQFGLKMSF
jgi:hypothetical protein